MRTKTFVSLLLAAVLLLIAAAAVYFFVSSGGGDENAGPDSVNLPKIRAIVEEKVISPIFSENGDLVWFMIGSKLYRQRTDGSVPKEEIVLPEAVIGVTGVIWPPRFLPTGDKVVYDRLTSTGGHELKIADADGNNFAKVGDLFRPDYDFAVSPNGHELAAWSTSSLTPSPFFLVDLFTGKFDQLGEAGFYRGAKFSPDGSKLLVSKNNQSGVAALALYELSSRVLTNIGLFGEIDQVSWSGDGAEIFLPGALGLLRYRPATAEVKEVFRFPEGNALRVERLQVHPSKTFVVLVASGSGFLYRVDISQ
ncbi:MAG: hypothetical protein UY65_C0007G0013 [Parcubacteria group bacterium GW2011_GWA2_51_12]|nr:MAG: hypothetical protein UY65_C0007G0013 [Parcubacteria group bacterium GW2011_GWA2_51_12]